MKLLVLGAWISLPTTLLFEKKILSLGHMDQVVTQISCNQSRVINYFLKLILAWATYPKSPQDMGAQHFPDH